MRSFTRRLMIPLAAAALLTGCATALVTVEDEEQIGAKVAGDVLNQIGLYDSEGLQRYVTAVGNRLVAELGETPYEFRFGVIEQFEPNAFAAPGGYIFISRGLLSLMNSEDELAGVLAHEISHVTERHFARRAGRSVVPGLLSLPGKAVGVVSEDLGNLINAPIDVAGEVFIATYSRSQELEADREGMRLAARAGYDPVALAAALDRLSKSVELATGESEKFRYTDSHPSTPTRLADIDSEGGRLTFESRPTIAGDSGYFGQIDGLWWGLEVPSRGIFEGQQFLHPDLNFTMTFPEGWETLNTPRFVGAVDREAPALIVAGGMYAPVDPAQLGESLVEKMSEKGEMVPAEARRVTIGTAKWPAYLVRFEDATGDETVNIYYLFVTNPEMTFTVIGFGADRYRDVLQGAALSMRNLTEEERESIAGLRVRIVEAQASESLDALAERSDSVVSAQAIAVINGLDAGGELPTGQAVKVILREPY
ncbi:MAG: M48 family metalloprotease [Pseudomonadota bacterium]